MSDQQVTGSDTLSFPQPQGTVLVTAEDVLMSGTQGEETGYDNNSDGGVPINGAEDEGMDGEAAVNEDRKKEEEEESGDDIEYDDGELEEDDRASDEEEPNRAERDTKGQELTVAQRIRPVTAGWIKTNGDYGETDSYFPVPVITFGIDAPTNIICGLCRVSQLRVQGERGDDWFGPEAAAATDSTPALMPCGHVAGADCLADVLDTAEPGSWACPFCRMALVYPVCGHRVRHRALTPNQLVSAIPATIPMGGEISHLCPECRLEELQLTTAMSIGVARYELQQARQLYRDTQAEDAALVIVEKVELIEKICGEAAEEAKRIQAGLRTW